MPPISKTESYFEPFDLGDMAHWVVKDGDTISKRRSNATFKAKDLMGPYDSNYSPKHNKPILLSPKIQSDSSTRSSIIQSPRSAFTPVKSSFQSNTRNTTTDQKGHTTGTTSILVQPSSIPLSSSNTIKALLIEKTFEKHFERIISPSEELVRPKDKERQRPPFEEIEIYPHDEDLVSELSLDLDNYDYEMENNSFNSKLNQGYLSSQALMDQSDQIIKRALELTSKSCGKSLNSSVLHNTDETKTSQIAPMIDLDLHQSFDVKEEKDYSFLDSHEIERDDNNRNRTIDKQMNEISTNQISNNVNFNDTDCRDEENVVEENHSDIISASSSIQIYRRPYRKLSSPPLKCIFVHLDSHLQSVHSELSKDESIPLEKISDCGKTRQLMLEDRIEQIKSRGRMRYKKENTLS